MRIKTSASDAGWSLREAAWDAEERFLWRGSDAAHRALARALKAVEPLQRLIQTRLTWPLQQLVQTRLTWPLADVIRRNGLIAKGSIAAVVLASGASAGGAALSSAEQTEPAAKALLATAEFVIPDPAVESELSGVAVDFETVSAQSAAATAVAAPVVPPDAAPLDAAVPSAPPAQVAWEFAEAFVAYEVGEIDKMTAATFTALAEPPLAAALGTDPPRLPAGQEVPKAKVLNVVAGEAKGKTMEVSVSLVRLDATSELRLTLRDSRKGWRVSKVLG